MEWWKPTVEEAGQPAGWELDVNVGRIDGSKVANLRPRPFQLGRMKREPLLQWKLYPDPAVSPLSL